jgi:hypothetical protein
MLLKEATQLNQYRHMFIDVVLRVRLIESSSTTFLIVSWDPGLGGLLVSLCLLVTRGLRRRRDGIFTQYGEIHRLR